MASIYTHRVIQRCLPLLGLLVSRIREPAIRLQQHSRTEIFLGVPPVRRAGSGAAGTENTFVQAIELLAVFFALSEFFALLRC